MNLTPRVVLSIPAKATIHSVWSQRPMMSFRVISSIPQGNERNDAAKLLPLMFMDGISLFDKGYPSFAFFETLNQDCPGFYSVRCPATSTFPAVEAFVQSGKKDTILWVDPSNNYLKGLTVEQKKKAKAIKLRCIRLVSPQGKISVLLTNLFDQQKYPCQQIIDLYFRR